MTRCDWCRKTLWPWQAKFEGRLYLEHRDCHEERVAQHSLAWMAMSPSMRDDEATGPWYRDLVLDGMIPDWADRP